MRDDQIMLPINKAECNPVMDLDGSWHGVKSMLPVEREGLAYNFEVGDFHTYFVGESDVWVHNCPEGPIGAKMPSGKSQLDHIFDPSKVDEGHLAPSTKSSRDRAGRMFENVASDSKNKRPDLVSDPNKQRAGIEMFTKDQRNGQIWVETRGSIIQDAGVNRSEFFR